MKVGGGGLVYKSKKRGKKESRKKEIVKNCKLWLSLDFANITTLLRRVNRQQKTIWNGRTEGKKFGMKASMS